MDWDKIWWDNKKSGVIRGLLRVGWRIVDGRLCPPPGSLNFDTPWIFVEDALHPHCMFWNGIFFEHFGLIPRYCRTRCHKVVVKPRTVRELFDLYHLMNHLGFPSKCGIDRRDYTSARYAAFFYCNSMPEVLARYKEVKEAVSMHLTDGANIPIIAKKGCTEMEDPRNPGGKPSSEWGEPSPEEAELEDRLTMIFNYEQSSNHQPAWLRNRVMYAWLEHAHATGDPTWAELCGDIFGVHSVTYHDKEESKDGSHGNHKSKELPQTSKGVSRKRHSAG